jgi:AraC family transcriptional activator of pobA
MAYVDRAPVFKLYGGTEEWSVPERVHCETIASRSRLHDWHIRPHRHSGLYQLLYLAQGTAIVALDEARHTVAGPAIVEIPQAFVHGFEFDQHCRGYVVTIAYPLLLDLIHQLGPEATPPGQPMIHRLKSAIDVTSLQTVFQQLNRRYRSPLAFRDAQIEAWVTLLYTRLRQLHPGAGPSPAQSRGLQHYTRFSVLLEDAYTEHHEVAWYASRMGLTPAHLNVITRAHAGKSPLQLIHERLALEAGRSLVYTTQPIAVIADTLGFSEPAHFTRFFRKMSGVSPRAFRQRASGMGQAAARSVQGDAAPSFPALNPDPAALSDTG